MATCSSSASSPSADVELLTRILFFSALVLSVLAMLLNDRLRSRVAFKRNFSLVFLLLLRSSVTSVRSTSKHHVTTKLLDDANYLSKLGVYSLC